MAPEIILGNKYTESADIFSVGMITWELLTGHYPFEGLGQIEIATQVTKNNLRPEIPIFCSSDMGEFLRKCWDSNPANRVTAEEALRLLSTVIP